MQLGKWKQLNRPDNFQNEFKRINTSVPATSKTIAKKLTNFTLLKTKQGLLVGRQATYFIKNCIKM